MILQLMYIVKINLANTLGKESWGLLMRMIELKLKGFVYRIR